MDDEEKRQMNYIINTVQIAVGMIDVELMAYDDYAVDIGSEFLKKLRKALLRGQK